MKQSTLRLACSTRVFSCRDGATRWTAWDGITAGYTPACPRDNCGSELPAGHYAQFRSDTADMRILGEERLPDASASIVLLRNAQPARR